MTMLLLSYIYTLVRVQHKAATLPIGDVQRVLVSFLFVHKFYLQIYYKDGVDEYVHQQ